MFDIDGDGLTDVYTANDSVANFLWKQERAADGAISFTDFDFQEFNMEH